jgi:hypothetical protein
MTPFNQNQNKTIILKTSPKAPEVESTVGGKALTIVGIALAVLFFGSLIYNNMTKPSTAPVVAANPAPIVQGTAPTQPEQAPVVPTVTPKAPEAPVINPTPAPTKKSQVDAMALLKAETEKLKNSQVKNVQTQSVQPPTKPQDDLSEGNFVGSLEDLDKGQGNNVGAPIQEGTPNDMQSIQDSRVNNPCTTGDEYCGTDRNSHTASNEAKYGSRTPDFINSNN